MVKAVDSLYKKFCEKINNHEYDYELKESSTLDSDFTDRLGSILSYSDINKETLSKLKNDQNGLIRNVQSNKKN